MNQVEQANYKNKTGLTLGDRMKQYENVTRNYLMTKQPVIVRLDGRAFHSYCKQKWVEGPFDEKIIKAFQASTLKLCDSVQNVEFAYHQSDEVTFFLKDYKSVQQDQHFNGNIQKISSTIASEFTYWFNKYINLELTKTNSKPAFFDCRVYNVPIHEVSNNFIWRQRDAIKNSITSYALNFFSHKQLLNKNSDEKIQMLKENNTPWSDIPLYHQRGTGFYKKSIEIPVKDLDSNVLNHLIQKNVIVPESVERTKWVADTSLPIFSEEKEFIEKYVIEENKKD